MRTGVAGERQHLTVEGSGGGLGLDERQLVAVQKGVEHRHDERSRFARNDEGRWMYLDGDDVKPAPVKRGEKVGRNQPCPCGSGKKYKHCHGS
jgi:preprotein translocase subunit SecA